MRVIYRIAFAAVALLAAGQALADTAANHVIRNTVSVDYSDAGNVFVESVQTSIDITVNLVQAAPDAAFDASASDPVNPVSTNSTITLVFDVTSNANGPDDYEMLNETLTDSGTTGTSLGSPTPDPLLNLGGSSASGSTITTFDTTNQTDDTAAGTLITVPADDTGGDSSVNGFESGDIIVLAATGGTPGDVVCRVNHITEPSLGSEANATASIYVDQCDTASGPELQAGDQLGERDTISITVNTGTTAGTVDFDADFDYVGGSLPVFVTTVTITVVAPDLNVYKFVRNVDDAGSNPTCGVAPLNTPLSCLVADGNTYYREDVTADPGHELQYAVLLFNAGGVTVTDIILSDTVVAFTSFATGSIDMIPRGTADDSGDCESGASGTCTVTETGTSPATASDATSDDYGAFNDPNVLASGGHDGSGVAIGNETSGGQLDADEVSVVFFSVTVD